MTEADDHFDVDRALGRLASRVGWLRWGLLAGLVLCVGLGWLMAGHLAVLWSDPLHPVVDGIHIPVPTLNASGSMERGVSATERGLAIVGVFILIILIVAYRVVDHYRRYMVLVCGVGLLGLVLAAQWVTSGDQKANRDIERLARAGAYQELITRVKLRAQMPYGQYIGAQALVMAGGKAELKAQYGDWLTRWSVLAERNGYLGPRKAAPGVPEWEGSHASPQVMRALEIAAFGNEVTPFSRRYLRDSLSSLAHARQGLYWIVPTLGLACVAWLGVFVTWRRARRNLRLAEALVVRFDYYQASPQTPVLAGAAPAPPESLPPIDFRPEPHAVP